MSSAEPFKYRRYYTTAKAECSRCGVSGPLSSDKVGAASAARKDGWYIGACFFCPACRKLRKTLSNRGLAK